MVKVFGSLVNNITILSFANPGGEPIKAHSLVNNVSMLGFANSGGEFIKAHGLSSQH